VADAVAALLDPVDGAPAGAGPVDPGLQPFWGRPVLIRARVDGSTIEATGTVVGLGEVVSVLTTTGVVEIPVPSIASLDHLHRT
jgi:hypothetical protein